MKNSVKYIHGGMGMTYRYVYGIEARLNRHTARDEKQDKRFTIQTNI